MVSISALVFDLLGSMHVRRLDSTTQLVDGIRRVTRTATLDGSAVVYDGGFAHADRVLTVAIRAFTENQLNQAKRLFQSYQQLTVSSVEGIFLCAAESYTVKDTTLTLRFLVLQDLTETP